MTFPTRTLTAALPLLRTAVHTQRTSTMREPNSGHGHGMGALRMRLSSRRVMRRIPSRSVDVIVVLALLGMTQPAVSAPHENAPIRPAPVLGPALVVGQVTSSGTEDQARRAEKASSYAGL